ncbi:unnamed protein product [Cochlearia groenlandica]
MAISFSPITPFLFFFFLSIHAASNHHTTVAVLRARAPSIDCTACYSMNKFTDCATFVRMGDNNAKPKGKIATLAFWFCVAVSHPYIGYTIRRVPSGVELRIDFDRNSAPLAAEAASPSGFEEPSSNEDGAFFRRL